MLFNLIYLDDEDFFEKFVNAIEKAYFDSTEYNQPQELTPDWKIYSIPSEEKQIEEINDRLEGLVKKVCAQESENSGKYIHLDCSGNEIARFALPFTDRFHRYFLKRRWNKPPIIDSIRVSIDELVCLESSQERKRFQNCSKNTGNFNHFMNVVLATARLIKYFTELILNK